MLLWLVVSLLGEGPFRSVQAEAGPVRFGRKRPGRGEEALLSGLIDPVVGRSGTHFYNPVSIRAYLGTMLFGHDEPRRPATGTDRQVLSGLDRMAGSPFKNEGDAVEAADTIGLIEGWGENLR